MPNLEFTCPTCEHRFSRVVMRGENPDAAPCPNCGAGVDPPAEKAPALFDGIAGFSDFGKDTN